MSNRKPKMRYSVNGADVLSKNKMLDPSTPSRLRSNQNSRTSTPITQSRRSSVEQFSTIRSSDLSAQNTGELVFNDLSTTAAPALTSSADQSNSQTATAWTNQPTDQFKDQSLQSQPVSQPVSQSISQPVSQPIAESPLTVRSAAAKKNAHSKNIMSSLMDPDAELDVDTSIFPDVTGYVAQEVERIQSPLPAVEPIHVNVESEKVPAMVQEYEHNLDEMSKKDSPTKSKSAMKRERKAAAKAASNAITSPEPVARKLDVNSATASVSDQPAATLSSSSKPLHNNQIHTTNQSNSQLNNQSIKPSQQSVQSNTLAPVSAGSSMLPTAVLAFRVVLWSILSLIAFDVATRQISLVTSLMLAVATTRLTTVIIYLIASLVADSKVVCYESGATRLLSIFSATCLSIIPFLLSERALPLQLAFGSIFLLRRFIVALVVSSIGLLSFASDALRGLDTVLACSGVTYLTVLTWVARDTLQPLLFSLAAFLPCFVNIRPSMALALLACMVLHHQTHFAAVATVC